MVSVSEIISLLGAITPRIHVRLHDKISAKTLAWFAWSEIGPIVCSVPATQFHYVLDASFPNVVVQVAARAFNLASNIAVYSAAVYRRNTMCVMYSRASIREPAYRLRIVGRVRRDYSTRREIVAAVSREPCVVLSNRPDPSIPLPFLLAFSRAVRETDLAESLLNGGSFIPKIGGQWRVNSRGKQLSEGFEP